QNHESVAKADVVLVYGAGGGVQGLQNFGKDAIIFQRWRSGEVYLQYEIVSPRFLRQHQDELQLKNIQYDDVVTDSLDELEWRLRALCGLKNARGTRILCVGGPDAWAQNADRQKILFEAINRSWNLDVQTVDYAKIDELLTESRADAKLMAWAEKSAEAYLADSAVTLETTRESVVNCFVLTAIFCRLMREAECKAITVFGCMSTIIPKAETTACLTLSLLNDAGYLAFCESDFAAIPSGIVLGSITGKPVFLNDPTYPHDHLITLAHCTAPRKMDGKNALPVKVVTHFESDYGAAPKVEFTLGQVVTNILPDFLGVRWAGFVGKIVDVPFRPICRAQFDVEYTVTDELVNARMPGFHWMTCYGDYTRELGYVLRRAGILWDNLDKYPKY
ncbi:MAG: sugar isomerase, partial [Thermoguttaceae bacterium]|nr:sugar isomerase [Thermoguttaceae bacterium]